MTATVICDQSDRPAWLKARMGGIGASDVPKLLGLNKSWGSPMSVYAEKILEPDAIEDGDQKTPLQEIGLMMEDWLLAKVAVDYEASYCRLDGTLFASAERPHIRCTRDGLVGFADTDTEKSVELKTRAFDDWEGVIPPAVYAQVQTQAYVLEEPEIIVGVCFRVSGERAFKTVPRDDNFINDVVLPVADEFWDRVQKQDPAGLEVDGSDWTLKALAALNPGVPGEEVRVMEAQFDEYADELVAIREYDKENKERKGWLRNQFAEAAGKAELLVLPSGRYFNFKETKVAARQAKAYSFRTPMGPFGGMK